MSIDAISPLRQRMIDGSALDKGYAAPICGAFQAPFVKSATLRPEPPS